VALNISALGFTHFLRLFSFLIFFYIF